MADSERRQGEILDSRYRLIERLGQGGFGDVWRAEELLPGGAPLREVALKLLHEGVADRQDWTAEARIIASLRHPALVTIYAAGLLQMRTEVPFVAMELLLGESLAEHVQRNEHVPWRRVLSWAREVAAALDEIHRAGVTHLDLKPANLFLPRHGGIKVLDFGIAQQGRGRPIVAAPVASADDMSTAAFMLAQDADGASPATGTMTRSVVGTPGFMAPEVFEGGEATCASDAYALAGCIVQLVTGKLPQRITAKPKEGSTHSLQAWFADVQAATVRGQLRDLRAERPQLPTALVDLVLRWLALDPQARGAEQGSLRRQLDDVWRCPHGWPANPFRALEPYELRHEGQLFGRQSDIVRVARELSDQPCMVLHGREGSGLRSLAVAGVVPELARSFSDGLDDWHCCVAAFDEVEGEEAQVRLTPDDALARALLGWLDAHAEQPSLSRRIASSDLVTRPNHSVARPAMDADTLPSAAADATAPDSTAPDSSAPDSAVQAAAAHEASGDHPTDESEGAALGPTVSGVTSDGDADAAAAAEDDPHERPVTVLGDVVDELMLCLQGSRVGLAIVLDDLQITLEEPPEAYALVSKLVKLALSRPPGLRLLGTLREDHTAAFVEHPLGEALRPWLRFVSPPAASAAADIVRGPLRHAGVGESAVKPVIADVQEQLQADGARLPLISLALHDWCSDVADEGSMAEHATAQHWSGLEGVVGALCRHADQLLKGRTEHWRRQAASVLLRFVSVDGEPLQIRSEALAAADNGKSRSQAVVDELLRGRLLVEEDGCLRLAHPALAQRWTWLVDQRLHDLDRLTFLEALRTAAARWEAAQRPRNQLWLGLQLSRYRAREASIEADLGVTENAFVTACRAAQRTSWILRAVAVACLFAVIAGAVWYDKRQQLRADQDEERLQAARRSAALGSMVTQSRRTDDPYVRVALLAAAIQYGTEDPVLPLELLSATRDLPPARFLSRQRVARPRFPWGDRWLVGGSGRIATVMDFKPIEGPDFAPIVHRFRTHGSGMHDFIPIPFDTSFISRGLDGQLKVWRLREGGQVALAAISPMRCLVGLSQVIVAERAPVIACATKNGVAHWDLRAPTKFVEDTFQGRVMELSPDGAWLAAARLKTVLLWAPAANRRHEYQAEAAPNLARFSPRDPLLALVRRDAVEVVDLRADKPSRLHAADTLIAEPVDARWHANGVDIAICEHDGRGDWYYLRHGGRHDADAEPEAVPRPCESERPPWPKPLRDARDYGDTIARRRSVGPREFQGGWMLKDSQLITHDLVMFDLANDKLSELTSVSAMPSRFEIGDSAEAVFRDGERVVWQVGAYVREHEASGKEVWRREGKLLNRCPDGRLLARRGGGEQWQLFGARSNVKLRMLKREPGFFVGTDPDCQRVYMQTLDGTLHSADVAGSSNELTPFAKVAVPGGDYAMSGYVYDARFSRAWSEGEIGGGLWLALSEGAIVRADAVHGTVRPYGHATPRATAMANGPRPGELLFADDTGLVLRSGTAARDRVVLALRHGHAWEDIHLLGDGRTALLAWSHGVVLVDIERGELLSEQKFGAYGRVTTWDDEGSVLLWPSSFMGQPRGLVLPIGRSLASKVGAAASNFQARLVHNDTLSLTLIDALGH